MTKITTSIKAAVKAITLTVVITMAAYGASAQQERGTMLREGWATPPAGQQLRPVPDPYSRTTMRVEPGRQDTGLWATAPDDDRIRSETVVLYFRRGSSRLESSYMDNSYMLAVIDRTFADMHVLENMDYMTITAAASPEGNTEANEKLAAARALAIKSYVMWRHPYVNRDRILTFSAGEDWSGLKLMVEEDDHTPGREEVLQVLDLQVSNDRMRSRLRGIGGGATYRYLAANMFPYLRGGVACMLYYKKEVPAPEPETEPVPPVTDTVYVDRVVEVEKTIEIEAPAVELERKPLFAVKTNLLFDAVSALNVEIEVPIGRRWSVAGEYIFPWWLWESKQYCLEALSANLEVRYWFGDRTGRPQMTGWFTGLYGGGGYYDVEWGTKGYQGEFFIATGVSGGYAHTVNRKGTLRMEYSLGAGYMKTKYREYIPRYGMDDEWHLIRQKSGNYTWLGPSRAKISLVWMLSHGYRRKGGSK